MREQQFVSFRMDDRLFGVDILAVREIIRNVAFTPVEKAPPAVRGLLNLRGQIVTVLDLGPELGLGPRGLAGGSRCIILKTAQETAPLREAGLIEDELPADAVGLLVDGIGDVVGVAEGGLDSPPARPGGPETGHLRGVVQLEEDLMMVLALDSLVNGAIEAAAESR